MGDRRKCDGHLTVTDVSKIFTNPRDQQAYSANLTTHKPGMTDEEVIQAYNNWAQKETYEQDLCSSRYRGPVIAADTLCEYFSRDIRTEIIVLDVAAGTGFVGEQLKHRGFANVDALDPAEEMMAVAKRKHIYRNYIYDKLGGDRTKIVDDTYDAVVSSGGMGEGHIPCSGLQELLRITRPGGIVCLVMREEYLNHVKEYKDRLEPLISRLQECGYWKLLQRTMVPRYSFDNNGIVFVCKVSLSGPVPT